MVSFVIVPTCGVQQVSNETLRSTAVIAHLYYTERFNDSFSYIRNVPEEVDTYIITANPELRLMAEEAIVKAGMNNIKVLDKPNRGRDFGALLVTGRQIVESHSYIGFIHDKMSHPGDVMSLGAKWEKCLFESVLGSRDYILGLLNRFETNERLGLISAPLPAESHLLGLSGILWTQNYSSACSLLKTLSVELVPDPNRDPSTIGTAFWFRTEALAKLFDYPWTYEDFPEEPLPNDGTIAHQLERIPDIVARDAGYEVIFAVNDRFAEEYLTEKSEQLAQAMYILRESRLLSYTDGGPDLPLTVHRVRKMKEKK